MSKIVTPEKMGEGLNDILDKLTTKSEPKINKGVRAALVVVWGNIIKETPVDEGVARGSWRITKNTPAKVVGRRTRAEDVRAKTSRLDIFKKVRWFMTSNLPYIRTLEYGEFPNPPKSKTGKTVGGYSKLAPSGMVRKNMIKWPRALKAAFKL
jgi:hypothetical protein